MTTEQAIEQAARLAAPMFAAMGWTWGLTPERTPTIEDIKRTYRELLAIGSTECGTGRLTVMRRHGGIEFGIELSHYEEED